MRKLTESEKSRIMEAVKPKVAIHCKTQEEADMMNEIMGWLNTLWYVHKEQTCYMYVLHGFGLEDIKFKDTWEYCSKGFCENCGYTIIEFSSLLDPKPNLIKAFHAIGVDWLHEGSKFTYEFHPSCEEEYVCGRAANGNISIYKSSSNSRVTGDILISILNHPERIKPITIKRWTNAEQADAIYDKFRFDCVARDGDNSIALYASKPIWDDDVRKFHCDSSQGWHYIDEADYPSLQCGEYASLEDIARGGDVR